MAPLTDSDSRMVRIDDLRRCVIKACLQLELSQQDAEQITEVLVDYELRGHDSHGVHLLGRLIDSYRQHNLNPRPHVSVIRETDSTLLLDGDRSFVVAAVQAMRWCMARARQRPGIALAGVRHSQLIVPGYYARLAAEAGLIGFACTNTPPLVAPPGGWTPTLGTNPFAYGLPAGRYPPVVLDVATSAGAAFKVRLAARRGQRVPEGILLDHEGQPSTEPNAFLAGGLLALGRVVLRTARGQRGAVLGHGERRAGPEPAARRVTQRGPAGPCRAGQAHRDGWSVDARPEGRSPRVQRCRALGKTQPRTVGTTIGLQVCSPSG